MPGMCHFFLILFIFEKKTHRKVKYEIEIEINKNKVIFKGIRHYLYFINRLNFLHKNDNNVFVRLNFKSSRKQNGEQK